MESNTNIVLPYESMQLPKYLGTVVIVAIGIVLTTITWVLIVPFIALALWILLSFSGIEIDPSSRNYRLFKSNFGFKKGKWMPLDKYNTLVIKTIRAKQSMYSRGGRSAQINTTEQLFDVYLAYESHRTKLFLKSCKSYDQALKVANEIRSVLDVPIQKYNPQISQATKDRKSRRR